MTGESVAHLPPLNACQWHRVRKYWFWEIWGSVFEVISGLNGEPRDGPADKQMVFMSETLSRSHTHTHTQISSRGASDLWMCLQEFHRITKPNVTVCRSSWAFHRFVNAAGGKNILLQYDSCTCSSKSMTTPINCMPGKILCSSSLTAKTKAEPQLKENASVTGCWALTLERKQAGRVLVFKSNLP